MKQIKQNIGSFGSWLNQSPDNIVTATVALLSFGLIMMFATGVLV